MTKNTNNILAALQNTQATANVLIDAVSHMAKTLDKCTPEKAGEILNDAVAIAGLAQLLLIDANCLSKTKQS